MLFLCAYITLGSSDRDTEADSQPCCDRYCHVTVDNVTVYHVNCSYRNLNALPELPVFIRANTVSMDLVGNRFDNLTGMPWEDFPTLQKLSLARNQIRVLEHGYFNNLSNLEVLDLSLNYIRYNNISESVFKPLGNLKYLDLKQNLSSVLETETYPEALKDLKEVHTLLIDWLSTDNLPPMPNLTELYLSGEYGRCNISSLNKTMGIFLLLNTSIVQHLYMSNCSIKHIDKGIFEPFTNLSSLDLARNTAMEMKAVPNITYGLANTIKRLNLNSMHDYITYDLCSSLDVKDVEHLKNTSLELFTIEKNYIVRLQPAAVDYFPSSLRYLSISDNMFMYGEYVSLMVNKGTMHNLTYFDTSKMYKTHIPTPSTIHLQTRQFDTTSLVFTTTDNDCIDDKQFTNLQDSMLTRKHYLDDFEVMLDKMKRFGIGLRNSSAYSKEEYSKVNLPRESKLEYLDLSENLPGTIKMTLDIFNTTPHLFFLNVSNNYLGYPLLEEGSNKIFEYVNNLRILDLSNNRITKLMPDIFDNLTRLEKLYLSNNRLSSVSFNMDALRSLTYLDLNDNHLEELNKSAMDALSRLHDVKINVAHNPLMCSCKNIEFVRWVHENSKKIDKFHETKCTSYNSNIVSFSELDFDQFRYYCSPSQYHTIILVVSLCILTFVIIVSCGLVYRFKWNLRYLYYMTKFKLLDGYQPITDREYEKEVFVSYSNEDSRFVRDDVVRELETNGNISLLIHDRDFRAGEFVADNILRAITSTRRTLVILTAAYIRSKWCMYEMNMARMEAADTARNVLCVILKEDIPTKYLPVEVIDMIKKKTYMEFPREREHVDLFWERLRATLKHDVLS